MNTGDTGFIGFAAGLIVGALGMAAIACPAGDGSGIVDPPEKPSFTLELVDSLFDNGGLEFVLVREFVLVQDSVHFQTIQCD